MIERRNVSSLGVVFSVLLCFCARLVVEITVDYYSGTLRTKNIIIIITIIVNIICCIVFVSVNLSLNFHSYILNFKRYLISKLISVGAGLSPV